MRNHWKSVNLIILILHALIYSTTVSAEPERKYSVGGGYGVAYGLAGVKAEYAVFSDFYLDLGLGFDPNEEGVGYAVGVSYYFRDQDKTWRPKISLYYGPVRSLSMSRTSGMDIERINETFYGSAIELGSSIKFSHKSKLGMDVGVTIALTDGGMSDRERELEDQGYGHDTGSIGIFAIFHYLRIGVRYDF